MADDHYAVLGVERSADREEIRRVYVDLARRHHPDLQGGDAVVGAAAEARMQRINEAWSVLSDPDRRQRYDGGLASTSTRSGERVVRTPPRRQWQPVAGEEDDPDDDIDPRDLIEDVPIGDGGRFPQALQVLPPMLVFGGMLALIVGLMIGLTPIVSLALVSLVGGALAFIATPFIAVLRSRSSELNSRT